MPKKQATPQEISDYLDDMKAGLDAGPAGTREFREAVRENQEQRRRLVKDFRCEGCGKWLDQFEVDGIDGRSHARVARDERGDAFPEICGPVRRTGATSIDPDGGKP